MPLPTENPALLEIQPLASSPGDDRPPAQAERSPPTPRSRVALLVAGSAVLLPFGALVLQLARHGTGFLVGDDWNVYLTSFDWLLRGDLTVLWASVSEHRVVLSRTLHFLEYTLIGDSRALLFVSPLIQLVFAWLALGRLSADRPFSTTTPGFVLRAGAWFCFAAMLFSPIQAWAFARTAYLEIFGLLLGALLFLLGLTRWRLGLSLAGLGLAVASTPGWLGLIVTAIPLLGYSALFHRHRVPLRRQMRFALPLLLIAAALALLYMLPFEHPNDSGAEHPGLISLLGYFVSEPLHVLGQYVAFLGFPVAVAGLATPLGKEVTPEALLAASRVFGSLYLGFAAVLLVPRLRARRALDLASCYVLFTLLLSFSIALARTPLLGQTAVLNHAYCAYVAPGWAFALYLWFRCFDEGSSRLDPAVLRNFAAAFGLSLLLVASSYQRGRVALIGTLNGQKYLMSLYVGTFLSPASEERRWEAARVLDNPDPARVFEGTAMLLEHDLVPRNWTR